ncbi:MAG: ABC transporter substrate-binding protein [Minwuia sp.]|uniref:ABC transporter substrate-binding protein n=1 Tax=Minwuia sp. TaxID=2493630 RepID=UPI003A871050
MSPTAPTRASSTTPSSRAGTSRAGSASRRAGEPAASKGKVQHMKSRILMAGLLAVIGLGWPVGASAEGSGQRVVTIGGSITEIVYQLNAQDRLVGVDSTSMFPPQALELPNVGYVRQLSAEPILALAPDLILAEADAGPPAAVDHLRAGRSRLRTGSGRAQHRRCRRQDRTGGCCAGSG